jgi:5-methylcytosine-specific restriction endonuclease McrA
VWEFNRSCKDCEQIQRVGQKNEDRPYAIIRKRCADHAHRADMPVEFFWVNMNYRALVPYYRAALSSEGLCLSCGHPYDDEKDIQIEHRAPPRHRRDYARLHARNLALACANCNGTKTSKEYEAWLDDCEETRLTNEAHRANGLGGKDEPPPDSEQLGFDL